VTSSPDTSLRPALNTHVPGRYPQELEENLITDSDAVFRLRPIRSDDAEGLVVFHAHLSFDSIYRRYFSLMPELSPEWVHHLTHVDYVDRMALVIECKGELVGVGRYDRCPPGDTAEVAFIVRDDYQRLGLAHQLLDALARAAWDRGITEFSAVTMPSNRDMMSVFRRSGYPVTTSLSQNEISVHFPIDPMRKAYQ
jgi:RimJ/RimL family protein N-acetyltransferase